MIELIYILLNRDRYNRFIKFIKDYTLTKESKVVVKDIGEYLSTKPEIDDIDIDQFRTWFTVLKHSTFKPDQLEIYHKLFDEVKAYVPKSSLVEDEVVRSFVQRDYATRIADKALKIAEGDNSVTLLECEDDIEEYRRESGAVGEEDGHIKADVSELYKALGDGLDWRLKELNKSLGPLRKGDLVVIGKLPESGGTAFAISEATHMLTQLKDDQVILYFGNEEHGNALKKRVVSSVINRNGKYVEANMASCATEFVKENGEKIKVHSCHGKSIRELESIIKKHNPALIVFDQLHKVHGFDRAGNDTARLGGLFMTAREIAAKYAPVLAIHQADGSAYSSMYVEMNQLYNSRIIVQGEADAIITIGISNEPGCENMRYINIPKNKLAGGKLSEERLRHNKFECKIVPDTSRFYD